MFVDSHCHINFEGLAERLPQVLENMRAHAVTHALCVSVDFETLPSVLAIAAAHDNVFASVGVHPDHEDAREPSVAELVEWAAHPKVVAIGETGPRLLPARRPLDRRHGVAARTLSHAYSRRACDGQAADRPHAVGVRRHTADHGPKSARANRAA